MISKLEDIFGIGLCCCVSLFKYFGGFVGLKVVGEVEIVKVEGINDVFVVCIYVNLYGLVMFDVVE